MAFAWYSWIFTDVVVTGPGEKIASARADGARRPPAATLETDDRRRRMLSGRCRGVKRAHCDLRRRLVRTARRFAARSAAIRARTLQDSSGRPPDPRPAGVPGLEFAMTAALERVLVVRSATKLLIALTGLALFLYLSCTWSGTSLLFLGAGHVQRVLARAHLATRSSSRSRLGLAAIFLLHVWKTVVDVVANRGGAPGRRTSGSAGPAGRAASRVASTTMIWTGSLTLRLRRPPRASDQVRRAVPRSSARPAGSVPAGRRGASRARCGWRSTRSAWCCSASTCGTASRAPSSRSASTHPRLTPKVLTARQGARRRARRGGFFFIPLWVFFIGGRS